MNQNWV